MILRTVSAAALLALMAGCGGTDAPPATDTNASLVDANSEAPPESEPETIPAIAVEPEPAEPIVITIESKELSASANIDGAIGAFAPTLGERIKTETEEALKKAQRIAGEEAGEEYFMPHDYQYDFIKTASVQDIISVEYMNMMFTGGAHPNYIIGGIIYDRASENDIPAKDLLSEAGVPAVKALLMEELAKKKLKRMSMEPEDLPILREEVADVFPKDIDFWFGEVTLVPSSDAGKFGGLVVHYSPYDVGAYAEGSYDILVSAADLDGNLAPDFAALFGGDPIYEEVQ